jgi:hypothetical protein
MYFCTVLRKFASLCDTVSSKFIIHLVNAVRRTFILGAQPAAA